MQGEGATHLTCRVFHVEPPFLDAIRKHSNVKHEGRMSGAQESERRWYRGDDEIYCTVRLRCGVMLVAPSRARVNYTNITQNAIKHTFVDINFSSTRFGTLRGLDTMSALMSN